MIFGGAGATCHVHIFRSHLLPHRICRCGRCWAPKYWHVCLGRRLPIGQSGTHARHGHIGPRQPRTPYVVVTRTPHATLWSAPAVAIAAGCHVPAGWRRDAARMQSRRAAGLQRTPRHGITGLAPEKRGCRVRCLLLRLRSHHLGFGVVWAEKRHHEQRNILREGRFLEVPRPVGFGVTPGRQDHARLPL